MSPAMYKTIDKDHAAVVGNVAQRFVFEGSEIAIHMATRCLRFCCATPTSRLLIIGNVRVSQGQ